MGRESRVERKDFAKESSLIVNYNLTDEVGGMWCII